MATIQLQKGAYLPNSKKLLKIKSCLIAKRV